MDIVNFLQRDDIALDDTAEIDKERQILEEELSVRSVVESTVFRKY